MIPGYSHYNFMSSPEIAAYAERFLRDPLTGATKGTAAASKAAP